MGSWDDKRKNPAGWKFKTAKRLNELEDKVFRSGEEAT